ncbi:MULTISPECIES: hypothetical protein [Streptomyces]|uniref:Htaa domain-containing protein n=2 Tax=Streptomyces TaxID=1883 RepID=A0ABV9IW95_9ACTN
MPVRSGWLSPDGQSREDTRLVSLGALTPVSPVATRSGVLPGSASGLYRIAGFTLTGTAGTMTATVSPGRALIQGTDAQGAYPIALTEYLNLVFADGDPLHDRVDLVVLRVHDDQYDASGRAEAVLEIVRGDATAVPAVPAPPALSLPLYQVTVPKGASAGTTAIDWSTLGDRRTATVGAGGILPVFSDTTGGSYPGQYRDVNGQLQRWSGTAWTDYPVLPTWQSWTPTWVTSTGSATPAFGNASLSCRYVKFGTTVHLNFAITFGSTTSFGSGATTNDNWRFSLPVTAAAARPLIGFAELAAGDAPNRATARVYLATTGAFELILASGRPTATAFTATGGLDSLTPWTWASGHTVMGTATYEAAS